MLIAIFNASLKARSSLVPGVVCWGMAIIADISVFVDTLMRTGGLGQRSTHSSSSKNKQYQQIHTTASDEQSWIISISQSWMLKQDSMLLIRRLLTLREIRQPQEGGNATVIDCSAKRLCKHPDRSLEL